MTQWQPSKCSIAQGQGKGTSESVTAFFQILFFHSFNGTIRLLELSAWTRKITLTNACCICQLRGTALVLADTYASDSLATAYDSLATLFHDWVMTVTVAASVCPLPLQYSRVRSRATSHCSSAIDRKEPARSGVGAVHQFLTSMMEASCNLPQKQELALN